MENPQPPPLSAAQLEVMHVVWERGDVSITEVWHALAERRKVARATVQTVMTRLEEKGWLTHRNVGQAFLYSAVVDREATQGRLVQDLIEEGFQGAADGLVWALLQGRGISAEEAQRIQQMIDRAEQKKPKGGQKR